jgi:DNA protecting protein DprA
VPETRFASEKHPIIWADVQMIGETEAPRGFDGGCLLVFMPRSGLFVDCSAHYGEHVAGTLASDLAAAERIVVAGGAYGIEGAAHRATLATGGDTIAVLANGVDRAYPAGHSELLGRVADVGLLVSEVAPGATPTRHRFLARARLMAALAAATVVVEAGARSGSMKVARDAHQLGRAVGAVPGPVTSATSIGPHRLLAEGHARLVTGASDLLRPDRHNLRGATNGLLQRDAIEGTKPESTTLLRR